jgi:hypothetical protein
VTDLAEAEAERVETELGTDEPEPELETEPAEPELETEQVAAGPTDADLRKFEQENARHERALEKIIGADFEHFEACGVCGGVGHVPAASNVDVPFERDPQTEPCAACNGYGTTLTGARYPGMVTRACSRCQGSGWTTVQEHVDVGPVYLEATTATAAAELEPGNGAPVDPRVAELRAAGYVILDPVVIAPAPGS